MVVKVATLYVTDFLKLVFAPEEERVLLSNRVICVNFSSVSSTVNCCYSF